MEKLLLLLEFPVLGIVAPLGGVVTGGVLAFARSSVRASAVALGALALCLFTYCAIFEGMDTHPVTIPGAVFGLLAVPLFLVPGAAVRLVLSARARALLFGKEPGKDA